MEINLKENERIDDLQLDNLKIIQNTDGFCFGIDSVLLSDFAKEIKANSNIIDLGTGTGIIAILLSSKTKAKSIIGVEIQKDVAEMAQRSILLNRLENRIKIINEDLRDLDKILPLDFYDTIVTNPPYIKDKTGFNNENNKKLISRHEVLCSIEDIAKISYKLLKNKGEIYMVHRPDRLTDIMEIFGNYKLKIKEIRLVYSNKNSDANLVLIKAVKNGQTFLKIKKPLFVYDDNKNYTEEILKIYNRI